MWNPIDKAKARQLREAIEKAVFNYCKNEIDNELNKNLRKENLSFLRHIRNENANVNKLYNHLASTRRICIREINDPTHIIGYINSYVYYVERINHEEEVEITINGKLVLFNIDTDKYVLINISDNVICIAEIGVISFNNDKKDIDISLKVRVPFK